MKKYFFIFCVILLVFSCSGTTGYKNPHEKRNLTVRNTTGKNIDIVVKARYNSVEYFNGTLNAGQSIPLNNVPLCMLIPAQGYDWRVVKTNDHSNSPVWHIRDVTEDEKLKVQVRNTNVTAGVKLKYRVKASGAVFETTPLIPNGQVILVKLYDADYEFELDNPPSLPPGQKYDISYDKGAKEINIKQVLTE